MTNTTVDYSQETSEPVATVLSRLEGVERLGPGNYEATCPVHKGGSKHLRVVEAKDGRAVVECENGCWLSEIVPALGLHLEDLFECIDDIYIGSEAPLHDPPNRWVEKDRADYQRSIRCPEGTPCPEWPNLRAHD